MSTLVQQKAVEMLAMAKVTLGSAWTPELQAKWDALPETDAGWLARYGIARERVYHAERQSETPASTSRTEDDPLDQLIRRVPELVTLSNGRTVPITSKSVAAYTRYATLWFEVLTLEGLVEQLSGRWDLKAAGLYREAQRLRLERLQELAAAAIYPGPDLPDQLPFPAWISEISYDDLTLLQLAHLRAGPARFAALPAPPPDAEATESPDILKRQGGFGYFLASIARARQMPEAQVLREDLYQLMAGVRATMQDPMKVGTATTDDAPLPGWAADLANL